VLRVKLQSSRDQDSYPKYLFAQKTRREMEDESKAFEGIPRSVLDDCDDALRFGNVGEERFEDGGWWWEKVKHQKKCAGSPNKYFQKKRVRQPAD
jgi:hypothetical protein